MLKKVAYFAGLLALFAVQHSVMARKWFKQLWTRVVPPPLVRSTYVLLSSLALIALLWQWRPMGAGVWSIDSPAGRLAVSGLFAFGWGLVLVSTFLINHFDLVGLRQVWQYLRGRAYTQLPFATPGPYRLVRHPLYLGWFFALGMTPTMTLAHLVERDLVRQHGAAYAQYRHRVPMILPLGRRPAEATQTSAVSELGQDAAPSR